MAKKDKEQKKKKREREELDMETTVADMNVDGFKWYNPDKKENPKNPIGKITLKEYFAMIIGAFRAFWPMLLCIVLGALLMMGLAYLWLM